LTNDAIRSEILTEFTNRQHSLQDLADTLRVLICMILNDGGFVVHSVTSRCKTIESLSDKLSRPDKSYRCLADVTDLTGLRITTYFADDVDRIASLLADEFKIDAENSIDKRQALDPDRFGYQSLHYVAELSGKRCKLAEYRKFSGLKFEIQVRSILQHAWAEIEHDIGYKSGAGVPREIRRRFSRVAGLLELADAEFLSIRNELAEYTARVTREIVSATQRIELNLPSLRALYTFESHVASLDSVVAEIASSELKGGELSESYLPRLTALGLSDIETLEQVALQERDTVKQFATYWLNGNKHKKLSVGVGLFYLIYVLLWKTGDKTRMANYFLSYNIGHTPGESAEKLYGFVPES
jgi:ppGpp synthetase/RelA/SpoT-type nucleotidyltranferase